MGISVSGPIFTYKIPKDLHEKDIHTLQHGRIIIFQFLIFMELESILLLFFDHQDTESE